MPYFPNYLKVEVKKYRGKSNLKSTARSDLSQEVQRQQWATTTNVSPLNRQRVCTVGPSRLAVQVMEPLGKPFCSVSVLNDPRYCSAKPPDKAAVPAVNVLDQLRQSPPLHRQETDFWTWWGQRSQVPASSACACASTVLTPKVANCVANLTYTVI